MEICNRIKDGNGKLSLERKKQKDLEGLITLWFYIINTHEQAVVHILDFDDVQRGNYFSEWQIRKTEVEVRVRKLQKRKGCR